MGRKHNCPPTAFARQTGFSDEDLELYFTALGQMFEHDRSAARGEMATRGLYVFKHGSELGNAHAHALFDRLTVGRDGGAGVPRSFADYCVRFDGQPVASGQELPATEGVTLKRRC